MDLPIAPFYLMNDIPPNTTPESLIRFLAAFIRDLPKGRFRFSGAPQDASDADVKDLKANIDNLEIRPSRLDDELRVSVIKFKNTPQCLLDLSSYSFPLKTELGKIWEGVDMASKDGAGQTALIRSVIKNNLELAEMLAEYENTDINAQDETGRTALHWACEKSLPELVGLCLSVPGLKINLKSNLNLTAFDIAGQKAYDSGDDTILTLFYDSLFELEKYDPDAALLQFLTLRAKPTSTEQKPDFPEHLQILTVPGDPEDPEEEKIVLPEEALSGPADNRDWELVEAILDRGISDNAGGDYINKAIEKAEEEEEEERRVGTSETSVGAVERRADIVERLKARTDVVGEAGGVDRPFEEEIRAGVGGGEAVIIDRPLRTEIRAGGGRAEVVDGPVDEGIGAAGGRAEVVDRPPDSEVRLGPVSDEVEGGGPRPGAKSFAKGGVGALGSFISRGIKNVKGDESERDAEDDHRWQERKDTLKQQLKRWREGDDRSEEELQRAVSEGDSRAVKMLLDAGVSANGGGLRKQNAWKWMGKDRRLNEGQHLEGQRLERQYLEGQTVLERAAERGDLKIVKLLLDAGADVNARSNRTRERSPDDAMANKVMISPRTVFRGVSPAVEQREQREQRINSDIIMEIERPDEVGRLGIERSGVERPDWMQTPLGLAAKNGHLEVVKLLLRKKADVNGRDDGLWTALHWAVWGSRQEPTAEVQTELTSDSPMVHPDVPGKRSGMLFGHKEMQDSRPGRMHPEIVDLLLERGADVHATDNDWLAALPAEGEASTADGGYGEILQKLRRKAAKSAVQDKSPGLPDPVDF